jgi:hypothetical protein
MAEQSIGWATTGTGDGVSGGYNEARMASMMQSQFGNGVLFTGNRFQRTWGANTVTVQTGACVIDGYFYENTSNVTINMTSGASGTYYLVVYINTNAVDSACHANVTANNPTATTIGAKTVRLAIVTSTAYATPPAGVDFIPLHTITWNGTVITAMTDIRQFIQPVTPTLSVIRMEKSAAQAIGTGLVGGDINAYATLYQMTDGLMTGNVSTGVITLNATGVYLVEASVVWATQATPAGNRYLRIGSASELVTEVSATTLTATSLANVASGTLVPTDGFVQRLTTTIIRGQTNFSSSPAYETIFLRAAQNSGVSQNITRASITVTRLSDVPPIV